MDSAAAQLYPNPTTELAMAGTYAVPVLHHLPGLSLGRRRTSFIGVPFKLSIATPGRYLAGPTSVLAITARQGMSAEGQCLYP